jgi:putative methionine-R-sulfoxide reductase with GAF domain
MQTASESGLTKRVENLLLQAGSAKSNLAKVLDLILAHLECPVGTIHTLDPTSGMLVLDVHRGLPESIMEKVREIPIGKGMAGVAAERKEPVQVCNLQTDTSGVVKPGARSTQMEGSVAVPMLVEETLLRGVLGVAKPVAYDFTKTELDLLLQLGTLIGRHMGPTTRKAVLDHYFLDARSKLIEIAAFLDRVERAEGEEDFRIQSFRSAVKELEGSGTEKARKVLLAFSDPTTEPIAAAKGQSACGAWEGAR